MANTAKCSAPPALPKAQSFPKSVIKVGAVLYRAYSYVDGGKTVTGLEEWVVRTIRARRNSSIWRGRDVKKLGWDIPKMVNLVEKSDITWGKLSSKKGDYGWRKYIPERNRKQIPIGADLPRGIYSTKMAALKYLIADRKRDLARDENDLSNETDPEEIAELQSEKADAIAEIAALSRRLKALSKSK
jgi:hypothetical protein